MKYSDKLRRFLILVVFCFGLEALSSSAQNQAGPGIRTTWVQGSEQRTLVPVSIQAKSIRLSTWIEQSLEQLTVKDRSKVDLVVVKNKRGQDADIPRSFAIRFPLELKRRDESIDVSVPELHRSTGEVLPVDTYRIEDVSEVWLTSYRQHYGSQYFLKNRRNPTAVRGEKRFIQNCMGCHSVHEKGGVHEVARSIMKNQNLWEIHRSKVTGAPLIGNRDRRAIIQFIRELTGETPLARSP